MAWRQNQGQKFYEQETEWVGLIPVLGINGTKTVLNYGLVQYRFCAAWIRTNLESQVRLGSTETVERGPSAIPEERERERGSLAAAPVARWSQVAQKENRVKVWQFFGLLVRSPRLLTKRDTLGTSNLAASISHLFNPATWVPRGGIYNIYKPTGNVQTLCAKMAISPCLCPRVPV